MTQGRMFWLGVLGVALLAGAVAARGHRLLGIEELTPPGRAVAPPLGASLPAPPASPSPKAPPDPRSLSDTEAPLPPEALAPPELVSEVYRVCRLLKEGLTARQLADQLGRVTYDPWPPAPEDEAPDFAIQLVPSSPYFSEATVHRDRDLEDRPLEMPEDVYLKLRDPRLLPLPVLKQLFGKASVQLSTGMFDPPPLSFAWPDQPKGKRYCELYVSFTWRDMRRLKDELAQSISVLLAEEPVE